MSEREQEADASPSQTQRDQQEAINKALDQTRNNVKKTINEAQKDVSDYARQMINLQERAFETTRNIAESYIESQREIFNSFNQSVWNPYVENVTNRTTACHGMFSLPGAEAYANTVGNVVDNFVTVARMVNKTVFANAGLINTSLQQASRHQQYEEADSQTKLNRSKPFFFSLLILQNIRPIVCGLKTA